MTTDTIRAAEQDCARTVTAFFSMLDARDHEKQWDQMASDGCWDRAGQDLNTRPLFLAAMAERPEHLTIRHMISNLLTEVDDSGTTATSTFNLIVYRYLEDRGDKPAPLAPASAIAAFTARQKIENGSWRIAHLSGETLFVS